MELCNTSECTSCMACYNACYFDAIELVTDALDTIKPKINTEKCKRCGRCKDVCQRIKQISKNNAQKAFAMYTKNIYDQKSCSSGGVATALSRSIIHSHGAVFGAVIENGSGKFICAENMELLERMKGSKYVYCFPGLIYRKVLEKLKRGQTCLFIGTPCQVAGLNAYLGDEWDNLVTVDLICHGTPPYEYLKQHTDLKISQNREIDQITFRGIHDYYLRIYDKQGNVLYTARQNEDEYFTSFTQGIILREVCYECPYAGVERVSDITIGDFWGLDSEALKEYKGKISVVLPNTTKGMKMLENHFDDFEYEIREADEAVRGNAQLRHPAIKTNLRQIFINSYTAGQRFDKAMEDTGIKEDVKTMRFRNRILFFPRKIKSIFRK